MGWHQQKEAAIVAIGMSNGLENRGTDRTSQVFSEIPDRRNQSWAAPMSVPIHAQSLLLFLLHHERCQMCGKKPKIILS